MLAGAGIVTAAGLLNMGLQWPLLREAVRSARWPMVKGRVTASEFQEGPLEGRYIRTTTGRAAVTYQYELNGRELTGDRIFVGDEEFGSAYQAQKRTRHYYPGVAVDVFYDPADPSLTVLETGLTWSHSWKFFLGAFLFGVGVFGLITAWQRAA
jgi:uncharacterized protein DUF3592